MTGYVTINTDASFLQKKSIGGFAYWIACDAGRIYGAGILKDAKNPLDAEIMAIANALHVFFKQETPGIRKMIINTDCKAAMLAIKNRTKASQWPSAITAMEILSKLKERYGKEFTYEFRHVQAHQHKRSPRNFVNDYCDTESRRAIRLFLKKETHPRTRSMIYIDPKILIQVACRRMKANATMVIYNGRDPIPKSCIWYFAKFPATCVFTREEGYHTSGWWKNPDYERCWHLSISFLGGVDRSAKSEILRHLFAPHQQLLWVEGPFSSFGKSRDIYHYRLFCDEAWQPVMPRGEVYSTQFTERGWKSFSELNAK